MSLFITITFRHCAKVIAMIAINTIEYIHFLQHNQNTIQQNIIIVQIDISITKYVGITHVSGDIH